MPVDRDALVKAFESSHGTMLLLDIEDYVSELATSGSLHYPEGSLPVEGASYEELVLSAFKDYALFRYSLDVEQLDRDAKALRSIRNLESKPQTTLTPEELSSTGVSDGQESPRDVKGESAEVGT